MSSWEEDQERQRLERRNLIESSKLADSKCKSAFMCKKNICLYYVVRRMRTAYKFNREDHEVHPVASSYDGDQVGDNFFCLSKLANPSV